MKDYCAICRRSKLCMTNSDFESACKQADYNNFLEACPEEELNKESDTPTTCIKPNTACIKSEAVRNHNIGNSNYAEMPVGYQPWDLWKIFHMNPWDADIQKRLLRTKAEPGMTMKESRRLDYEKIIHVCQERINQIDEGYEF